MKHRFCCEASRGMYVDYYRSQSGNGVPIFQGSRGQRGHGLGSILAGFFRSAMPILKRGLSIFGKQALRTGAKIANDVADGQSFRESTKRHVGESINEFAPSFAPQSGSGKRKRRIYKKAKRPKRLDIFG